MENGAQNLILLLSKNTCAFGMSIQFIYLDFILESLFCIAQNYF